MRRLLLAVVISGCYADFVEPWQLDHDRVIAVRATPPHIAAGEVSIIDALVAHAGGSASVDSPRGVTAPDAPGGLFTQVHYVFDHYEVQGADDATLAPARAELGLPAGAPVPVVLTVYFGAQDLTATKTIYLGDSVANPALPALLIDDQVPGATLDVPAGREILLHALADDVRWLTSCGSLAGADQPNATLYVSPEASTDGEFAVVVRDPGGGVVWQVWPITAH